MENALDAARLRCGEITDGSTTCTCTTYYIQYFSRTHVVELQKLKASSERRSALDVVPEDEDF